MNMKPFQSMTSIPVVLLEENIDTDQLCPKQHLTRLERTGFADALFSDKRFDEAGRIRPDFILNQSPWNAAGIVVAGDNFGSGSSREHAVWALVDFGIRCVIAPSFGDIFFQNSVNSGLLAIRLPLEQVELLAAAANSSPGESWTVDLAEQQLRLPGSDPITFDVEPNRKHRLMAGLDEIAMTLQFGPDIVKWEEQQRQAQPWLWMPIRT